LNGSRIIRELGGALLVFAYAACCPGILFGLDPNRNIDQYTLTRWSASDSFPGGGVNAIAQTRDGYLWIGAENGLVRFDGSRFRLFDHSNTPSLPTGHILGLLVDSEGVLWVRMESPYLLRYRRGVFEQAYRLEFERPGVSAMARDRQGRVLVAEADVVARYSGREYSRAVVSANVGGLVISMAETADGAIFTGMRDIGLVALRGDGRSAVRGLPDQKVNVLLAGNSGDLWIGTDAGLTRWNGVAVTQTGVPSELVRSQILALARDHDSNLWVSTPRGVARVDSKGAMGPPTRNIGLGPIHAMFEDREGNLWFGGTHGLVQLRDSPFLTYPGVDGGSTYVDHDWRVWFGPASGGLVSIRGTARHPVTPDGLNGDVVYSITGGSGDVWVGRRRGGLTRLREDSGAIVRTHTYTANDGLAPGGVYAVHRAPDGSVWAGTLGGGLSRIQNGQVSSFSVADGLSGDPITTIQDTPDGMVWVGTTAGLQALRGSAWRIYRGQDGLPPGRVNSLAVDENGGLWIGAAAGLFYWSRTRDDIVRYAPEILQSEILGVTSDTAGHLWVASDRRVLRLLRRSGAPIEVREFGMSDGLPSTQLIQRDRAMSRDRSGRIWFALRGGLCVVDPARAVALPPASPTIESVEVDGVALNTGASYLADRRRIAFNFIAVSLSVPARVRYRYRLDPYDAHWSQPTELREADYTNLAPGAYQFRLIASNGEGLWNGAEAIRSFTVEPLWWQAPWFRLAVACLTIACLFAGYRYRLSRVRAAMNSRFEERLAERTLIAQELHDTLLQGFLSASMQLQVAADLLPEGSKSRPLFERALQLMQQVIEEGRITVRGLRSGGSSAVPLETALSQIKDEVGVDDRVNFQVILEGVRRELHPLLRDEIYRIGREALINAFRHAKARHVEVELNYSDARFRLFVRDDGEGIEPNVLRTGRDGHWGLVGMRERADKIGAHLHVFSRPSAGTEIELDVPANIAFRRPSGTRTAARRART
jgi:ligand-binding sensor domain-containing protein/signal transduction histidine kinase